jgi:hypothetical protein
MTRRSVPALLAVAVLSAAYLVGLDTPAGAARDHAVGHQAAVTACRRVRGLGTTFSVDVLHGRVNCATARHVIEYVLTHGKRTQGSPGKSPPGWQCGYGYGFYHGNHEQSGRAGPSCSSGSRIVQGTEAGYSLHS